MNAIWKIYWAFIALKLFGGIALIGMNMQSTEFNLSPVFYGYYVLGIFGVVGLFGFTFNKALLKPLFWLVVTVMFLCVDVLVYIGAVSPIQVAEVNEIDLVGLVYFIPFIPQFYGLFKYSSKNHKVWC